MYTIYALIDPRTEEVRYVGCTTNLESRMWTLKSTSKTAPKLPVHRWIAELASVGLAPEVKTLEQTDNRDREEFWILHIRSLGSLLTNVTTKSMGLRYRWNIGKEPKEKRIQAGQKLWQNPSYRERVIKAITGLKRTEEQSAKVRGENNRCTSLTNEQVREIKKLLANGTSQRRIAALFSMSTSGIQHIVKGRTWSHIKLQP